MDINATLIGQAIWCGIFIWITMKYVWPPLQKAMADRQKLIADGLAAGERGQTELELAAKRAAEALREAKEKAAELIAGADHYTSLCRAVDLRQDDPRQPDDHLLRDGGGQPGE